MLVERDIDAKRRVAWVSQARNRIERGLRSGAGSERAAAAYIAPRMALRERLAYVARVVNLLARSTFELKYAGSVLGYIWSLAKPMTYFAVLWLVFARVFKSGIHNYPLYLLIGIVLNTFLVDAVTSTLPSIVTSGATIRRISFPALVIPVASSLAAAFTFLANCVVVAVFLAVSQVSPELDWLLLVPLLFELYIFVLALAMITSTLYVRFRDVGQIWEVAAGLLFFAAPIMYPLSLLPEWAQRLVSLNPFVQVMQDVRTVVLGPDAAADGAVPSVDSRLFPIAIVVVLFLVALRLYRRESPRFAERA